MTDEQRKKTEKKIMILSGVILALVILALVLIGVAGAADTLLFPIVIAAFLAAYWVVTDVLSVKWLHSFEGKTDEQKKSYYIYAGLDAVGLGGLVYFLVDMESTTGAIIYICCLFLKKRFRDEFNGVKKGEEEDAEAVTEEAEADTEEKALEESEADTAEKAIEESEASAAEKVAEESKADTAEKTLEESEAGAAEKTDEETEEDMTEKKKV